MQIQSRLRSIVTLIPLLPPGDNFQMNLESSDSGITSAPLQPCEAGKWLIAGSVLLGTFLSVMDVSVANIAMPHMMGSFRSGSPYHHLAC